MFVTRETCPTCGHRDVDELCDLEFSHDAIPENLLAGFLEEFYQSRLQSKLLAGYHYTICECQSCKLVFQKHILNDTGMELLYSQWISAEQSRRKRQQGNQKLFRKYAAECEIIARMIGKPSHEIRVVEFGMGWGYWCRMAAAFNYQVTGLELSSERVAHAQSLGVNTASHFSDIEASSIDFIYANQVIEHVASPVEIITQLKKLLTPTGVLMLRVPDGRGIADELRANGWNPSMSAIHPLEHINAFTRSCLLATGQQIGLTEISAPFRLSAHTLTHFWRSAMREYNDRFRRPHVYLRQT